MLINIRRFVRFSLVGVSGVAVNQGLLFLLTNYVLGERLYLAAAVISTEMSVLNNFIWNEVWTFKDKHYSNSVYGRLLKFHGSRLLGILIGLVILYILTDVMGIHYLFSNLASIAASTIVNYLTSDLWVWR
ncbi:hypothetical protein HRbin01_00395 [archaeon HR01]|nr:hypothetical protein HRbin01_00395 [archaeon HR01]